MKGTRVIALQSLTIDDRARTLPSPFNAFFAATNALQQSAVVCEIESKSHCYELIKNFIWPHCFQDYVVMKYYLVLRNFVTTFDLETFDSGKNPF